MNNKQIENGEYIEKPSILKELNSYANKYPEKEIEELKAAIKERVLDRHYADSFEQSAQISKDIKMLQQKLDNLERSISTNNNKKSDVVTSIENKNIKPKLER